MIRFLSHLDTYYLIFVFLGIVFHIVYKAKKELANTVTHNGEEFSIKKFWKLEGYRTLLGGMLAIIFWAVGSNDSDVMAFLGLSGFTVANCFLLGLFADILTKQLIKNEAFLHKES